MSVALTISEAGIAEMRLTAPARRNPLGFSTLEAIMAAINEADVREARVMVFCSDGPVFSAGADLQDLTGTAADIAFDDAVSQTTATMRRSRLPIVVAVQGPCMGAAVDVVLAADMVIAARSAHFEVPATRLGLLYNPAAVASLHQRFPSPALKQLLLGIPITADNAVTGGLIAQAVADDALMTTVTEAAERIAAGKRDAVTATKSLLASLDTDPFNLEQWTALRLRLLDSDARRDAIASVRRPLSH
jgi:enoyl-CoA hydratase/carnithine racemase